MGSFSSKKGICCAILLLLLLPLASSLNQSGTVPTELDIPNTPPLLLRAIPNQSWQNNTYKINAFDLDDYFTDPSGIPVNYSYTLAENITVVLDSSNNVSFYPDWDFIGVRNMTFYAFDEEYNTSSNLVFLFVGMDTLPPQWTSVYKDRALIYQNDYVNFSALWWDDFELKSYIFSINQGIWVNYTGVFGGRENISQGRVQISLPSGSIVQWKFCAYDASSKFNCTDIQEFNVSAKSVPTPGSGGGTGGGGGAEGGSGAGGAGAGGAGAEVPEESDLSESWTLSSLLKKENRNFTVDVRSFKVSLRPGSSETRILDLINIGNQNLSFSLVVHGLANIVKLSESEFLLAPGGTKKITVDFRASKDEIPGQYFGELVVNSAGSVKIPIILDINPYDLKFEVDVNITERYKNVRPGKSVRARISVKSLKDLAPSNLTLYIALKDLQGNIYDSYEEQFLLNSLFETEKELEVPTEANGGEYLFYARASNDKDFAIDSDFFEVGFRFMFAAFLKSSFVFVLIAVLSVLAVILVSRYRHEKERGRVLNLYVMLSELKKLIKENKFDEAVDLYIRIKAIYKEPVSRDILENKEKLKEEIKKLSGKLALEQENSASEEQGNAAEAKPDEKTQKDETKEKHVKEAQVVSPKKEDEDLPLKDEATKLKSIEEGKTANSEDETLSPPQKKEESIGNSPKKSDTLEGIGYKREPSEERAKKEIAGLDTRKKEAKVLTKKEAAKKNAFPSKAKANKFGRPIKDGDKDGS